jgi:hypothetical protein
MAYHSSTLYNRPHGLLDEAVDPTYFPKGKKASMVGTVLRSPIAGTSRLLKELLLNEPEASIVYMPELAMGWKRSADNASDTAA